MYFVRLDDKLKENLSGQISVKVLKEKNYLPLELVKECDIEIPEELIGTYFKKHFISRKDYYTFEILKTKLGINKKKDCEIGKLDFGDALKANTHWQYSRPGLKIDINDSYITSLRINRSSMTYFPKQINEFEHLNTLCLDNNELISFPRKLGSMNQLETLVILNESRIYRHLNSVGDLSNLKKLYLSTDYTHLNFHYLF